MIRILLVDDQNLIQEGIKALLDRHKELKVIGTVRDGRRAIKLVDILQPDIVLLDIEMPGMDGITVTKYISCHAPKTKVIILTSHEDKKYVTQALLAGAKGYILKSSLMTDLKQAILAVDSGYSQLESRLLAKVFNASNFKIKKGKSVNTLESDAENYQNNQKQPLSTEQNNSVDENKNQVLLNNNTQVDSEVNKFLVAENNSIVSLKPEIQQVARSNSESSQVVSDNLRSEFARLTQQTNNINSELPELLEQSNNSNLKLSASTQQTDNLNSNSFESLESTNIDNIDLELSKFLQSINNFDLELELPLLLTSPINSSQLELPLLIIPPIEKPQSELFTMLTQQVNSLGSGLDIQQPREQIQVENTSLSDVKQQSLHTNSKTTIVPISNSSLQKTKVDWQPESQAFVILSTFKDYFNTILYQKNNLFDRLKINLERLSIVRYFNLKISRYNLKSDNRKIRLTAYKLKVISLLKLWQERGILSNIAFMVIGGCIFFLIHSIL